MAIYFYFSTLWVMVAEKRLRKLCPSGSKKPCYANNFSFFQGKAHISESMVEAEMIHLEHGRCCIVLIGKAFADNLTSRHIISKLILIKFTRAALCNIFSTAEDGIAFCNLEYFVQFMRNKEDGNAT